MKKAFHTFLMVCGYMLVTVVVGILFYGFTHLSPQDRDDILYIMMMTPQY